MNLPIGVPALAGPSRLKAGLRTDGTPQMDSWSQCMRKSAFHEPQGAAGILPAVESGRLSADETSAAPYWRQAIFSCGCNAARLWMSCAITLTAISGTLTAWMSRPTGHATFDNWSSVAIPS